MGSLKNIKNTLDSQLMRAIKLGDLNNAQDLVHQGANVNYCADVAYDGDIHEIKTPLSLAAEKGHINILKWLINAGANKDEVDYKTGLTPLFRAAKNNHLDCVRCLHEHGCMLNSNVNQGIFKTALLIATEYSNALNDRFPMINYLLENGADINGKDKYGYTALMNILEKDYDNYEIIKKMIDHGASIDVINDKGQGLKDISQIVLSALDALNTHKRQAAYSFMISYYEESRLKTTIQEVASAPNDFEF